MTLNTILYKTKRKHFLVGKQLLKVICNNNVAMGEIVGGKFTMKIPEQCHWRRLGVFIVNSEQICRLHRCLWADADSISSGLININLLQMLLWVHLFFSHEVLILVSDFTR